MIEFSILKMSIFVVLMQFNEVFEFKFNEKFL